MREILFRGKRLNNGEWVEGFYNHLPCGRFGADEHMIQTVLENGKIGMLYDSVPSPVGQYTGLPDKHDKRIFEGDVVSQIWYDYEEPRDTSFGEVVYCECDCSFSVMDDEKDKIVPLGSCAAYVWEVEVIGNVHDNPELLEGCVE